MKAVVITVSTKGYLGEREDKSGPALKARLEKIGFTVTKQLLLPDDREKLRDAMKEIADGREAELIVTTGGTGFAKDDCTPEATLDIVERRADGIPEAMRAYSSQFTGRNGDHQSSGQRKSGGRVYGLCAKESPPRD